MGGGGGSHLSSSSEDSDSIEKQGCCDSSLMDVDVQKSHSTSKIQNSSKNMKQITLRDQVVVFLGIGG